MKTYTADKDASRISNSTTVAPEPNSKASANSYVT